MADITPDDVRGIYDTQQDNAALKVWIDAATSYLSAAQAQQSVSLEDSDETTLAKLLSAHFAAGSDPTTSSETIADNSYSYEGPTTTPDGLGETRFGRRAMSLASAHGLDLTAVEEQSAEFISFDVNGERPRHW